MLSVRQGRILGGGGVTMKRFPIEWCAISLFYAGALLLFVVYPALPIIVPLWVTAGVVLLLIHWDLL